MGPWVGSLPMEVGGVGGCTPLWISLRIKAGGVGRMRRRSAETIRSWRT